MIRRAAPALALAALAALPAAALESAQWPPPEGVGQRMRELQEVLRSPEASPAQREAAREELSGLLRSPAGQARGRTPDERPARAARAAIDPYPSVVRPAHVVPASPPVPASEVARVEVVVPPKPVIDPRTGSMVTPGAGGFAIDPKGGVLHGIPGGYIDPRTGQVIPR